MNKPILSPEVERQVLSALAQYKDKGKWRDWGLTYLRQQGACILMFGPPGTGKTITAKYMANKMKYGIKELDISDFGSQKPGENERNLSEFYAEAARDDKAIILDEADSILWDRSLATDNQWMVAVINHLLKLIASYKHPQFILTNRRGVLDKALDRRILVDIEFHHPTYEMRLELWKQKIPKRFPLQPTAVQLQELANADLTGAEIENVILSCAGECIVDHKLPTFDHLCNVAKTRANILKAREITK